MNFSNSNIFTMEDIYYFIFVSRQESFFYIYSSSRSFRILNEYAPQKTPHQVSHYIIRKK